MLTQAPSSLSAVAEGAHDFKNSDDVFRFDEEGELCREGEELFAEGQQAFYIYKVISGAVACFKSLPHGRRSIDAFRFAGDIFGFDGNKREFSAVAISNTFVRLARRDALFLRAAADSDAGHELLEATHREIQRVQRRTQLLAMNARQRIAWFLVQMSDRLDQPDIIELPMSRRDIGDYLGLRVETVCRTFAHLEGVCLIESRPARYVALLDPYALRQMVDSVPKSIRHRTRRLLRRSRSSPEATCFQG
jgi:CRP/FNR family nitrogen fixation transcriptional regulator